MDIAAVHTPTANQGQGTTSKRQERAREQDSPPEDLTAIETIEKRYQQLMDFVDTELDPSNRVTKGAMAKLRKHLTRWAFAQAKLVGINKARKVERLAAAAKETSTRSYASVASASKAPLKTATQTRIENTKKSNFTLFLCIYFADNSVLSKREKFTKLDL